MNLSLSTIATSIAWRQLENMENEENENLVISLSKQFQMWIYHTIYCKIGFQTGFAFFIFQFKYAFMTIQQLFCVFLTILSQKIALTQGDFNIAFDRSTYLWDEIFPIYKALECLQK